MALTALAVGLGETFLWPRLVIVFGTEIRWLFLVGVTVQLVVMMEMARWAMATGESIFFGAARIHRAAMWFFYATGILIYIFPGHVALGAQSLETLWGIPWVPTAIAGLVLIGLILTFSKVVYNVVETVLTTFISILVIGSAIIASLVGELARRRRHDHRHVLVRLHRRPSGSPRRGSRSSSGRSRSPVPPGCSRCGTRCGCATRVRAWATTCLASGGFGASTRKRPCRRAGSPSTRRTPRRWRSGRAGAKWNVFDAGVLFWGITMVTTVIYTVLALSAAAHRSRRRPRRSGPARTARPSPLWPMPLVKREASFARVAFFLFIAIVGWKLSFGIFDALARGNADMTYYFMPAARKWSMSRIYLTYVWIAVAAGTLVLTLVGLGIMGNEDGPGFILNMLAFLSAFVMGAYCLVLLCTNKKLLPKKLQPRAMSTVALCFGCVDLPRRAVRQPCGFWSPA